MDTTSILYHSFSAFPAGARLHVLPDGRRARLVVEAGALRQRWRESAWLPAYRWSAKLLRWGFRVRFAVQPRHFTARSSDHETNAQNSEAQGVKSDRQAGADFSGHGGPQTARSSGLRVAVRIGTADARQKLTLLMLDDAGNLCRVAKVGDLPLARRLVQHEAEVLRALPDGIGPKLLWAGRFGECDSGNRGSTSVSSAGFPWTNPGKAVGEAIVFEPVQGKGLPARLPRSPSGWQWREVDAFLARLTVAQEVEPIQAFEGGSCSGGDSVPPHEVLRGCRVLAADSHPGLVALRGSHPKTSDWIAALSGRVWPVAIEHGDFAPWNLLRTSEGLRAIDWEDGRLEGFPGFDLVHFVIQTGVLMHRWGAERVRRYAEERLQATGLTAQEAGAIVKLAALRDHSVTAEGEQDSLQGVRRELFGGG